MKVEISIHAAKLKNVAGAFKGTSDPFAVVTRIASQPGDKAEVLGRTEVIKNTLSPQWVKTIQTDYELGTPLKFAVSIFDEVRKGENKPMGSAIFEVGELLGARGNAKAKKLQKDGGTLFAMVRKATGSGVLRLELKGTKLKNVEGLFGKSDPFFELSRRVDAAGSLTWDNVYRSKMIKNNLNPVWEAAVLELSTLCGGDLDQPILLSVFDHESSGKHVPMGQIETSVNGFQKAAASGESFTLKNKGKDSGTIQVVRADVSGVVDEISNKLQYTSLGDTSSAAAGAAAGTAAAAVAATAPYDASAAGRNTRTGQYNFIDYVSGGAELNVVVAIDFTGSNGDPRKPGTLHHIDPTGTTRNDYEKAISAIISILSQYDSDQNFPVLGFGAKYDGVVRHCFQCGPTQEVHGVQGVLNAYHQVFKSGLIMSGPTVFTEVMETAAEHATTALQKAQQQGKQAYTILLILTDGAVSDVQATASCLDRVSSAPLSVVIVGVGNADFSPMQFLDDVGAKAGKRDVAQFVAFNQHSHSSVSLTSETLREIPDQLVGCFQSRGIAPLPPIQRSDSTIFVEPEDEEIDLSLDITDEEIVVSGGGDGFVDGFNASR